MGYIADDNTLNPLIEKSAIINPYGGNPGLDYEHMNSLLDANKKNPVVRKVDTRVRNNYKDPRSVSSDPSLVHTPSSMGYEPRTNGMYNIFRDLVTPKVVEPMIKLDSENSTDEDIVYSAAGVYTNKDHGYSAPFSTPSRNLTILETPTREGDSHPSVLTNRQARMRK